MNETLIAIFCLESISHKKELQKFHYDVISHITDKQFLEKLPKHIRNTEEEVWIKLKDGGDRLMGKRQFEEHCQNHFTEYYEEILTDDVFTLICHDSISSGAKEILNTMINWCSEKQKKGTGMGFVVYGYDLFSHLKVLKSPDHILQSKFFDSPGKDFIIVYSQSESLIFLIRKANNKNLDFDIELSTVDMTKFLLVFHDVLENSGIKLINLLAIDGDSDVKCEDCKCQVISMMSLTSSNSFEKWRKKREKKFETSSNYGKISQDLSIRFAGKMFGFLALFKREMRSCEMLSCLPNAPVEQITEGLLMTREQLDIVCSSFKYIIIRGCYGSGKTIVALKKAEIISRLLRDDDSLWYVICDSRSKLIEELKVSPKLQVFCNKMQMPASFILQDILEIDSKQGDLNIIFDEFDGETLDEAEAKKLDKEFKTNKRLKNSNIILIPQPLEIQRTVSSTEKQGNKFDFLETMNSVKLKLNMRNTLRINRLVMATVNALKSHTVYFDYHSSIQNPLDPTQTLEGTANKIESRKQVADVRIYTKDGVPEVQDTEKARRKRELSKSKDLKGENSIESQKFEIDKDSKEEKPIDSIKFNLDEACEYSVPPIEGSISIKMISNFKHKKSNKSRHKIEGKLPNLYEIDFPEGSSKLIIQLIAMLKHITAGDDNNQIDISNIANLRDWRDTEKLVILHFDARQNIPNAFNTTFKLMGILSKVTTKYDEFKNNDEKKFFISSYRAFRGLEYARIIVVMDPSLYQLLHYLPECLNRCTTNLHICILKMLNSVENYKSNEPFLSILEKWKKTPNDPQLVKQWKIDFPEFEKKSFLKSLPTGSDRITIRGKREEYADLEEQIKKIMTKTMTENHDQTSYNQREMECIKQR